jgi:8-oxo-dGTP pyrophosphatase MutT (NUDIX family)
MDDVRRRLAAVSRTGPSPGESHRRAGVLVPLFVRDAMLWVVFTRRTETVEHHAGQISFPGGAWEPEDDDLSRTALRETE